MAPFAGCWPATHWRAARRRRAFRLSVIRRAYELADADPGFAAIPATDDCGVVLRYLPDVPVGVVMGSERNLKITYAADLAVAQALLGYRGETGEDRLAGTDASAASAGHEAARAGQEAAAPAHVHRRQRERHSGGGSPRSAAARRAIAATPVSAPA